VASVTRPLMMPVAPCAKSAIGVAMNAAASQRAVRTIKDMQSSSRCCY
jgi:hypothetical protein